MDKIVLKKSPAELARAYGSAKAKIDEAYALLDEAAKIYNNAFNDSFIPLDNKNSYSVEGSREAVIQKMKKYSWRQLIDMMQVQKITSNERWKEIQEKLYGRNDDLPEISEQEIINIYRMYSDNASDILKEAIKEVWDYLRPGKSRWNDYKTNSPDRIGKKVILQSVLSELWSGKMQVSYFYQKELSNVDKVFHAMDGNVGSYLNNGYKSELVDSVNTSPEEGETKYFSWKGYKNGNLHLTLKRMDIVEEMSRMMRSNEMVAKV